MLCNFDLSTDFCRAFSTVTFLVITQARTLAVLPFTRDESQRSECWRRPRCSRAATWLGGLYVKEKEAKVLLQPSDRRHFVATADMCEGISQGFLFVLDF